LEIIPGFTAEVLTIQLVIPLRTNLCDLKITDTNDAVEIYRESFY
jgi:hypothetical protein